MKDVLPFSAATTDDGHLSIGGLDAVSLAEEFGTPLVVFDRLTFEERARIYSSALPADHVHYAGKSFCCVAICELVDGLGLSLDVCTGGELATALAAGFPPKRITFHGNNKSETELAAAQHAGVGRIVVDSFDEIERLATSGVKTKLMIRVTPGVEAHTHEFVQTGQEDSKFGFTLHDGVALEAIKRASEVPGCDLAGLHAHIGSQIFELAAFDLAIARLAELAAEAKRTHGFVVRELNLGGGLGIAHTRDEMTPDPAQAVDRMRAAIASNFAAHSLEVPEIYVEPGRSIVGPSAVTLYRIGTVKRIPGVRTYV
ncbi:MAG: diaminopimelate decarboxylase, partial [Actinobacteria bacterium]|nr:diaminopimelate decarboxylase [Actinomycetota bacterium]